MAGKDRLLAVLLGTCTRTRLCYNTRTALAEEQDGYGEALIPRCAKHKQAMIQSPHFVGYSTCTSTQKAHAGGDWYNLPGRKSVYS